MGVGDGALVGVVDVFQVRGVRVGVTEEQHFRYGAFGDDSSDVDVAGFDLFAEMRLDCRWGHSALGGDFLDCLAGAEHIERNLMRRQLRSFRVCCL